MKFHKLFDGLDETYELPGMDDIEAGGHADAQRVLTLTHERIAGRQEEAQGMPAEATEENVHHGRKKKINFFAILIAAALTVALVVGGGVIVCASDNSVSDKNLQQKLTDEYKAKIEELKTTECDRIIEKYGLEGHDISDIRGAKMLYYTALATEAEAEERQIIRDIINRFMDNKYENYPGFYDTDYFYYATIEDYGYYFNYVNDVCYVYNTQELTEEEKLRILNFLHDTYSFDLQDCCIHKMGMIRDPYFENCYPEEQQAWKDACNNVNSILCESNFENRFGWNYYEAGRTGPIEEDRRGEIITESYYTNDDPVVSE